MAIPAAASDALPASDAPPTLHAQRCLGQPLPPLRQRGPWPQLFKLDQLGLSSRLLDTLATHTDALCWDTYDVAQRRRRLIKRHHGILQAPVRTLLDRWDGSEQDAAWLPLLDALPSMLRAAVLRVVPHRRRALRKYGLDRVAPACWNIQPLDDPHFEQPASGDRAPRRTFALLPAELVCDADLLRLLAGIAETVHQRCGATRLAVSLHQMLTLARPHCTAEPAPEGVHQDGADYIVSALVIRRHNVCGGNSRVYLGRGGRLLLSHTLAEGQGLFQPDARSPLWHEVTAIHADSDAGGERMILGLDIHVLPAGAA
ncbi:2OG-Fe dioxygenase family protein [Stenotrophomonas pavanii]|uniref:2OG-Fe dioxygenase family protein n=1 Tax=Stenotrophomonas pavanii TaxID=487698 RepID=UPI002DB87BF1|nr:2OG-Fe dioxygenase family protein [Stenotrophomonas pavanii]MEC4339304.1 2OG-Fe dioxygenase family protein [Stenotrophomonas pavanii]